MDWIIEITDYGTDQERRKALADCTDIMWEILSGVTSDEGTINRFLLAKDLHNKILGQMSNADPCVKNP
jgi:hypothetical protein